MGIWTHRCGSFPAEHKKPESTVLPAMTSYLEETFAEMPEVRSAEDHGLVIWVNLPSAGILSVPKYEYTITALANLLAIYRRNGVAIIVHANRASQFTERTAIQCILLSKESCNVI